MKKKWRTKQDIRLLRSNKNISLQNLADLVYSTNTSLFRVEKLGYCADEALARNIADVLEVPFDELFEEYDASVEAEEKWKDKIKALYSATPKGSKYCVLFLTTYDNYTGYSACVPTVWIGTGKDLSFQKRTPRFYETIEIVNCLKALGLKPAIVENEEDFIHFFYSTKENKEAVALITADKEIIRELSGPIEIQVDYPFGNKHGLGDCYYINRLFA